MSVTPRKNGGTLDRFNDQLRASQAWQDWMRANGINPNGPIRLSDQQRKQLQAALARSGVQFGKGMEIDPAGNVNQNQSPGKKIAIGAAIGGGALTGLGALGIGPMAGLFGGGAAGGAGATAGGVLPSSHLSGATLAAATQASAPAIASGAASAGIPLGGLGAGGAAGLIGNGVNDKIDELMAAGGDGGKPSLLSRIGKGVGNALTSDGAGSALASLLPMLMARGAGGGGGNGMNTPPQLNSLLDMTVNRAQRTDPLHQMVTRLAESRMPTNMRG